MNPLLLTIPYLLQRALPKVFPSAGSNPLQRAHFLIKLVVYSIPLIAILHLIQSWIPTWLPYILSNIAAHPINIIAWGALGVFILVITLCAYWLIQGALFEWPGQTILWTVLWCSFMAVTIENSFNRDFSQMLGLGGMAMYVIGWFSWITVAMSVHMAEQAAYALRGEPAPFRPTLWQWIGQFFQRPAPRTPVVRNEM